MKERINVKRNQLVDSFQSFDGLITDSRKYNVCYNYLRANPGPFPVYFSSVLYSVCSLRQYSNGSTCARARVYIYIYIVLFVKFICLPPFPVFGSLDDSIKLQWDSVNENVILRIFCWV